MKNERDNIISVLPDKPEEPDQFSFEAVMKKQSKEIVIKDFVSQLNSIPSNEQIDKASSLLNNFRMKIQSGSPISMEQSLEVNDRIKNILSEPTNLDKSRRSRRTKNNTPKKAA